MVVKSETLAPSAPAPQPPEDISGPLLFVQAAFFAVIAVGIWRAIKLPWV